MGAGVRFREWQVKRICLESEWGNKGCIPNFESVIIVGSTIFSGRVNGVHKGRKNHSYIVGAYNLLGIEAPLSI